MAKQDKFTKWSNNSTKGANFKYDNKNMTLTRFMQYANVALYQLIKIQYLYLVLLYPFFILSDIKLILNCVSCQTALPLHSYNTRMDLPLKVTSIKKQ